MNLFIDTNIYLTFFHFSNDDLEELKKLKVAIQEGKINLLLPEQVIEEYKRNREIKIADALREFDKLKLPSQFPRMCKDYTQYEELREKITQYEELKSDLLERLNSDIESKQLGADKLIEELFEVATKIPSSPSIISVAKERYDKGNPPGKNGSYGDAINWESLLLYKRKDQRQQEIIEDLHIVARDKDYLSPIDPERFSRYLSDEWKEKKSSEINYYKSLSDFFSKRFPDIRLASDLERQFTIANLVSSGSFARTHLEIAKIAKYSDLTPQEVNEIVDGLLTNPQISRISQDPDVQVFVKQFVAKYSSVIDGDKASQLEQEYELVADQEEPSPSPSPEDIEDVPF